jgi:hypothetical protein
MKTNTKRKFLIAVKTMATGNTFISQVAKSVPEQELPPLLGVAAFELISTLELLRRSWRFRRPLRRLPTSVRRAPSRTATVRDGARRTDPNRRTAILHVCAD